MLGRVYAWQGGIHRRLETKLCFTGPGASYRVIPAETRGGIEQLELYTLQPFKSALAYKWKVSELIVCGTEDSETSSNDDLAK